MDNTIIKFETHLDQPGYTIAQEMDGKFHQSEQILEKSEMRFCKQDIIHLDQPGYTIVQEMDDKFHQSEQILEKSEMRFCKQDIMQTVNQDKANSTSTQNPASQPQKKFTQFPNVDPTLYLDPKIPARHNPYDDPSTHKPPLTPPS
jgi:hypothetical protein